LAVWALLSPELAEAALADDGTALLAVEWRFGQLEADDALQLLEAKLLRDHIGYLLLNNGGSRVTVLNLMFDFALILWHVIIILIV
jgi:hypothetical protein